VRCALSYMQVMHACVYPCIWSNANLQDVAPL
jgi:hypothetical protein